MSPHFHTLTVSDIQKEMKGVTSVLFTVPNELKDSFNWRSGQHLTLRITLKGEEYRRSYSISSSPFSDDPLRITVKHVKGGTVSKYINEKLTIGDQLEIMPPLGQFCLDPASTLRRTHYLFGAGSGITPLFSMLQSALLAEPYSRLHLLYGNTNGDNIIFKQQLAQLQEHYRDRLSVSHVLSKPSIWSSQGYWRKGRLNAEMVGEFINEHPPYAQDAQYYICGPGQMNTLVKTALMGLDVPAKRIHSESYGGQLITDEPVRGMAATVQIKLGGTRHNVQIAEGQTVLAAARAAGLEPAFSCQAGVCGACRAQLIKGSVHMKARIALEDDRIANGEILSCQALATSPELVIEYRGDT